MYVVLTTKPGEFRTEMSPGVQAVETYDYIFYGRKRASFTIAKLADDQQAGSASSRTSRRRSKTTCRASCSRSSTRSRTRAHELKTLTSYGSMDIQLKRV